MRSLLIFLFLLIVSVWAGVEIMRHPGYLLLVYQPWMVQMPIWFAAIVTLFFLVLFYLLIDSIDRLEFLWFKIKNWFRFRKEQQHFSKTQLGIAYLIEERYKKAENILIANVNQTVEPLLNYLGAAYAAHQQKGFERRDTYLQKAYQVAPRAELAIGITQAQLELEQNQLEQTQATLHRLQQLSPRHPAVLRLLEKVYVRLGEWPSLLKLLPAMRKAKMLSSEQYGQFEKNVYAQSLRHTSYESLAQLSHDWNAIPRHVKKNPEVVLAYVQQLLRFPNTRNDAEQLIHRTLKHQWNAELVNIYGSLFITQEVISPVAETNNNHHAEIPFYEVPQPNFLQTRNTMVNVDANLKRQLVVLAAWLKMYGPKSEILLALGKICMHIKLWGKAKDYFERCLAQGPNPEASLAYGQLLEQLNEPEAALVQYRLALEEIV